MQGVTGVWGALEPSASSTTRKARPRDRGSTICTHRRTNSCFKACLYAGSQEASADKARETGEKDGHIWIESLAHSLAHSKLHSIMHDLDLGRKTGNYFNYLLQEVCITAVMFAWTAWTWKK